MRWENLTVGSEEARRLPGYRDPAVVRTFDAPEAMDIRFWEVKARSALNRVPKQSRMPFRWTINPYRGCSHACTYCTSGDTRILLADGTHKPLAEIRPGDAIYGTERRGVYRRYVITEVLNHWETSKKAYRVTLEDGTELVASGDHRFLSDRGWKFVTGTEWGRRRRPHLTLNNKLLGTGGFAAPPEHSEGYRRGYLCGLIRGDGHVGSYSYDRPGRNRDVHHRFRLALTDFEALARARDYLLRDGVPTREFLFHEATAATRTAMAIRSSASASVARVRSLIEWPRGTPDDWCRGFLAGIYDAEGNHGQCIRIANTDPEILDWTMWCLRRLGFSYVVERSNNPNGLTNIRIRGGLEQRVRFFHAVDPAITRKRSIEGSAIKTKSRLRVVAIEPLGTRNLFDITTGTGDFIANGVVSHNCFARPTHEFLDMNAGRDFEREIVVKVNLPEVLRAELARPSWSRELVALGTNTDPYQWVEKKYELTRGVWEAMRDFANPCSVLTKSPLLLRDLDLMKQIAERTDFTACLSIPTLDQRAWRETEPHTPNPKARIEAVAELNRAGIPTGVLVAPLMPGINDSPAQVQPLLEAAAEAGATSIGSVALHLRPGVKEVFFEWLRAYRPDLVERYEEMYDGRAYLKTDERRRIQQVVDSMRPAKARRRPRRQEHRGRRGARGIERPAPAAEPTPPEQTALF